MNSAKPASRLPDFVIIGAMKSATSTLQEQLALQSGIFMCDPKEPNFFSDDSQYRRGVDWYSGLFSGAPVDALMGEASTHYTKLPTYEQTVARMHELLPGARMVYVMRHPIDRLVSHYIHEWSMGNIHGSIDEAVRQYPEMIQYGEYSMQLIPFFQSYGRERILPVFFDRLTREPQAELERVCKFIGYKGAPKWIHDIKPSNVSSERLRRFPLYDLVVKSEFSTWLRRTFVPRDLRNWIKASLTMKQRPKLDPAMVRNLEVHFNHDLDRLGGWMGTKLTCENFKEVTGSGVVNWSAPNA
jgi:hypothetical protein